jgi:hypothetical protein
MNHIPVKLLSQMPPKLYFENNQVLTAEHLNVLVKHFDYQDRLARTALLGAGIVCGLNIFTDEEAVVITHGCGITTDGDILHVRNDLSLDSIAPLDDKAADYIKFKDPPGGNNEVADKLNVWELSAKGSNPDAKPLGSFLKDNQLSPDNCVVMLYLKSYMNDRDICDAEDCDNKGLVEEAQLKVVMLIKSDYERIRSSQSCCSDGYYDMPDAVVKKVLFNEDKNLISYNRMIELYVLAIADSTVNMRAAMSAADIAAQSLSACLQQSGLLPAQNTKPGDQPGLLKIKTGADSIINFEQRAESLFTSALDIAKIKQLAINGGVQYYYDYLKDIADAYNEFKEAMFDICQGCCIEPMLFPKHLALGTIRPGEELTPCEYRQCFIESPILNHSDKQLQDAVTLYMRLIAILQNFEFINQSNSKNINNIFREKIDIRVTPSASVESALGDKAIPFYYAASSIVNVWNPAKTRRRAATNILSYRAGEYTESDHVRNPLNYDWDKYPFFRIEGHIGKEFQSAFDTIDKIRRDNDLPFDILGLQLENNRETVIIRNPIRFPHIDIMHDWHKINLKEYLTQVDQIADDIAPKLPADNIADVNADFISKHGSVADVKSNIVSNRTSLKSHISSAINMVANTTVKTMPIENFNTVHANLINTARVVNSKSRLFMQNDFSTPLHNITQFVKPHVFQWMSDYNTVHENSVKDAHVLSNFLQDNPSLLHNCGVNKGGTFILIYTIVKGVKTVVADFYVPYNAKVDPARVKVDTTKVDIDPIKLPKIDFGIKPDLVKPPVSIGATLTNINGALVKNKLFDSNTIFEQFSTRQDTEFTKLKSTIFTEYQGNFNTVFGSILDKSRVTAGSPGGLVDAGGIKQITALGALGQRETLDLKADVLPAVDLVKESLVNFAKDNPAVVEQINKEAVNAVAAVTGTRIDVTKVDAMTIGQKTDIVNNLGVTLDAIKKVDPILHADIIGKINIMGKLR